MTQPKQKRSYRETLNLPRTDFAMKANLVQQEPATLKRWEAMRLYERIRAARRGAERFVFHDGPPYANGPIHIGHLLNKSLKDFIVRSRTMMGFDVPFIPGWDCHGQPIEHKVVSELGDRARGMGAMEIRRRCQASAEKFIGVQMKQMQRLLTLADYEHPYITMEPGYEAAVLEVFAEMVGKGLVYRALKPVHWSIENRTALAEAELEYYEREDISVYVKFEVERSGCGLEKGTWLMIWTTTPWTLPANLAVAVHPEYEYGEYEIDGQRMVVATGLAERVFKRGVLPRRVIRGRELAAGTMYRHPFIERISPVITADYVTLEDGTGLVHTAPGHGLEDYQSGLEHGLEIYCPVREDGTFDETVPAWLRGVDVWRANELIVERLRASGHLYFAERFTHSYPHDWRGKTPTIFRATEQWFIGVDRPVNAEGATLRRLALEATEREIAFYPAWGRNRLRGMLEARPDWCISRQRSWGLPIPAFFNERGEYLLTAASVRAVAKVIGKKGSDAWFELPVQELLAEYRVEEDPAAPVWVREAEGEWKARLRKGADIFDVWFESGCSWYAALKRLQGDWPADLYLEGSDQHRGWFQVSLLPGLAVTGRSPFKAVLTHGWTVDKEGRKMSKSLGNTIEVDDLLKELGADVCRWWVCSTNTENDIKVDMELLRLAGEEYRKIRNTIRFLLSNLYDFDPARDGWGWSEKDARSLDAWALGELNRVLEQAKQAYLRYEFPRLSRVIYEFCNTTLSAVYLFALKDRLYCDRADSPRRRRAQDAMWRITDALVRLIAPIMPHTAEEAWGVLHRGREGVEESVHLAMFSEPVKVVVDADWTKVMAEREAMLKVIEEARQGRGIDNPLDIGLIWPEKDFLRKFDPVDLADLCGISRFALGPAEAGPQVQDLRGEPRCERSWKRDGTVRQRADGGMLSDRDAAVLGLA